MFAIVHTDATELGIRLFELDLKGGYVRTISGKSYRQRYTSKEVLLGTISDTLGALLAERRLDVKGLEGLVLITPGPIDRADQAVLNTPNVTCLRDMRIGDEIRRSLPDFDGTIYFERDAVALTLAESRYGHGRKLRDYAVVYLGTGVGAGLVLNGRLYTGAHGYGSEFGHMTLSHHTPELCHCGSKGCLECFGSGKALVRHCSSLISIDKPSSLVHFTIAELTYAEIVDAADHDDAVARRAFSVVGEDLGAGIRSLFHLLDLEAVILGGPLAIASRHFLEQTRRSASEHAFIPGWNSDRILMSECHDWVLLSGAAVILRAREGDPNTKRA
jgi:glucokinase